MSIMLALLAAASVVKLAYSFPPDVKRVYDVKTSFEGFIPILGGHEGKVAVDLVVTAKGLAPSADGLSQVLSTLDDIKVAVDDAPLPIVTLESAQEFFPPTTVSINPFGATLKTDAKETDIPVKLPGLDSKRFPDITYLPLQLPEEGAEAGKPYSFKKAFGDSDVSYTVTPTAVSDETVEMNVVLTQSYEVLENEGLEVVKDPKDAYATVKTEMKGKGSAVFDRKLGLFRTVSITADAVSKVVTIEKKKQSERKLKSILTIKLRK
jgi:hypothetical protein